MICVTKVWWKYMSTRRSNWSGASLAVLLGLVVFPLATPRVVLGQGRGNGNNGGGTNSPQQLVITTATIDVSSAVITIAGRNLGTTAPDAFLGLPNGGIVDLSSEVLVSPTELTATLPVGILPGNYLLVVRSGNGSTRIDSMDITIGGGAGSQGATGPIGPPGPQGPAGADGADGATGAAGTNGTNGADGATGPQGPQGNPGVDGATGPTGAAGTNGTDGATGAAGADGADGATGPTGAAGTTGPAGTNGTNGANGADGATGPEGPTGPQGLQGPQGSQGPTGPNVVDSSTVIENGVIRAVHLEAPLNLGNGGGLFNPNDGIVGINGFGDGFGVLGSQNGGLRGETSFAFDFGVHAINTAGGVGLRVDGDSVVTGSKSFVQPHPTDPSKEVAFVSLEGPEANTFFRGTTTLVDGRAEIVPPKPWRFATGEEGITALVTARGPGNVWVERESRDLIVIRGTADVAVNYMVLGVRYGFGAFASIRPNQSVRPIYRGVPYAAGMSPEYQQLLIQNGTLNPDLTPNEATALRLGWHLEEPPPHRDRNDRQGDSDPAQP